MEVAPDDVPPFVVAEIPDPNSFVDVKLLRSIEAQAIAELRPYHDPAVLRELTALCKANTFSVSNCGSLYPGLKQPGLGLANAFGVPEPFEREYSFER